MVSRQVGTMQIQAIMPLLIIERGPNKRGGTLGFCDPCSEIAKPRVGKPRVFINGHPDPPNPAPKTCENRSLHSTMHSYTFPYKEGRVLRGFLGWEGRLAIYQNPGFQFLNPGFRNLRHVTHNSHDPRKKC